ncbi:MAG TPA: hypothetical protein VK186_17605 [Candidatus Deferrimicrobium sp.]|nr:hypothetical protein [Candidatus Deferrimicrobium sp.]
MTKVDAKGGKVEELKEKECKVIVISPQKGEILDIIPKNRKDMKWSHTCSYPNRTVQIDLLQIKATKKIFYGTIEYNKPDNGQYNWEVGSYWKDGRPRTAPIGKYQIKISVKSNGTLTKCSGVSEIFELKP